MTAFMLPDKNIPEFCVWELTRACNISCVHCGSSAGAPRNKELDTREAMALIAELGALGCLSITLSGGEPLLRPDWRELVSEIHSRNIRPEIITNGLLVEEQADAVCRAEFFAVTISVDGTSAVHDSLRGRPGSLDKLLRGAKALKERGVLLGAVTQVNRKNLGELDAVHDILVHHGFRGWQVQLTVPYGRAQKHRDGFILRPRDLLTLESSLVAIRARSELFIQIADTIGYMGRAEPLLRSGTKQPKGLWGTCSAGTRTIGITSDGTVRGCLSMPPDFDEGNIRERSLSAIWQDENAFAYNRRFDPTSLGGQCAVCPLARFCRGGCPSLAFAASGSVGTQPYCLRSLY